MKLRHIAYVAAVLSGLFSFFSPQLGIEIPNLTGPLSGRLIYPMLFFIALEKFFPKAFYARDDAPDTTYLLNCIHTSTVMISSVFIAAIVWLKVYPYTFNLLSHFFFNRYAQSKGFISKFGEALLAYLCELALPLLVLLVIAYILMRLLNVYALKAVGNAKSEEAATKNVRYLHVMTYFPAAVLFGHSVSLWMQGILSKFA